MAERRQVARDWIAAQCEKQWRELVSSNDIHASSLEEHTFKAGYMLGFNDCIRLRLKEDSEEGQDDG